MSRLARLRKASVSETAPCQVLAWPHTYLGTPRFPDYGGVPLQEPKNNALARCSSAPFPRATATKVRRIPCEFPLARAARPVGQRIQGVPQAGIPALAQLCQPRPRLEPTDRRVGGERPLGEALLPDAGDADFEASPTVGIALPAISVQHLQ